MNKEYSTIELKEIAVENTDKWVVKPFTQEDTLRHDHHFFELVYITGGSASHMWNGKHGVVAQGDYFIVDYGSYHRYTDCKELTLINCLFLPEIMNETFASYRSFDDLIRGCFMQYNKIYWGQTVSNRVFHDEKGTILGLLSGMQREYEKKDLGYLEIFRCRLMEIMIHTMRCVVGPAKKVEQDTLVEQLLQYIEIHYTESGILKEFCSKFHFSEQYVSRRFRQITGGTIIEYIQKTRVEKGCELLAATRDSVAEIAAMVGYSDVKFFHKVFRRWLNMSPREYRKLSV